MRWVWRAALAAGQQGGDQNHSTRLHMHQGHPDFTLQCDGGCGGAYSRSSFPGVAQHPAAGCWQQGDRMYLWHYCDNRHSCLRGAVLLHVCADDRQSQGQPDLSETPQQFNWNQDSKQRDLVLARSSDTKSSTNQPGLTSRNITSRLGPNFRQTHRPAAPGNAELCHWCEACTLCRTTIVELRDGAGSSSETPHPPRATHHLLYTRHTLQFDSTSFAPVSRCRSLVIHPAHPGALQR